MPLILAGFASLAWGFADFAGGFVSQRTHYLAVTFWRMIPEVTFTIIAINVVHGEFYWSDMAWGAASGLAAVVALPLFYKALAEGQMGVVAPVSGTVGSLMPFVVGLVSGERPSDAQLVGVVLAIVAIFLVSTASKDLAHPSHLPRQTLSQKVFRRDVQMGVVCGVGFGMVFVAIHETHTNSGVWPYLPLDITMIVGTVVAAIATKTSLRFRRADFPINTGAALIDSTGGLCYLYATRHGFLSIVGVLSSMYPVVTVALAAGFLKERFTRSHLVGLGTAVFALGLIGAG